MIFHYHALLRGRKDAITARPAVLRLGEHLVQLSAREIFLQLGNELRDISKDARLLNVSNCFDSSVGLCGSGRVLRQGRLRGRRHPPGIPRLR